MVPPAVWTGPEEPVADVDPAVVGVVVEGAAVAWVVGGAWVVVAVVEPPPVPPLVTVAPELADVSGSS